MWDRSVLACLAHPDDEQLISGLFARTVAEGGRAALLVTTRGEAGDIHLAGVERAALGAVREGELRRAVALLGLGDEALHLLGYRDSGMAGWPDNAHPQASMNAAEDDAVGRVVAVIRAFRPTLVFTFDANGAYGHPDHLAVHQWTNRAFAAAGQGDQYPQAGPPFQPARLFYASLPRSLMAQAGLPEHGFDDELCTHRVDVSDYLDRKWQALLCHATQIDPDFQWWHLPADLHRALRGTEWFQFAAGVPCPPGAAGGDLYAGLELEVGANKSRRDSRE